MRLAQNNEGNLIKCQDIENGIIKSNEYYCNKCNNIVFFVSKSERNCSYFKHKNNSCIYYISKDNNYYEENIMSKFHMNWQEMFPNENIEYKIEKNNKIHYADIYISNDNVFNIFNIFEKNKNNLIIEIQYSAISYDTLYERETFYVSNNTNLLWIFDIKNKCEIEKIVLFKETIYKIRLNSKHYFTELFKINNNPNILLDNGGLNLFLIINNPCYDKDLLIVKKINKSLFLNELSKILNKKLIHNFDTSNNKINLYDYESIINKCNQNKNELRYIFYILETIPFCELNDMFDEYDILKCNYDFKWSCNNCSFKNYWNKNNCYKCKYSKPFNIDDLISILSILSNKNKSIINLFVNFIEKNKTKIKSKLNFGKYSNYKLVDIPIDYLKWLCDNKNDKYCKCHKNNDYFCINCKLYEDIYYILRYSKENIINKFMSIIDCDNIRYFDYTITDFVDNYNKCNNKKNTFFNDINFKRTLSNPFIDDD